ncbi:MAG TPA: DUF554 domain-containing protein [Phycisphaerae bacterium]|nr:DUF554 domain-containing protein [Phycisphaerae bacterium]
MTLTMNKGANSVRGSGSAVMWSIFNGTIVNVATVAVGSTVGLLLAAKIPQRYQRIILDCLGLVTVTLAIDASVLGMGRAVSNFGAGVPTYGARLGMVMIGSLIVGSILGTALRLHERIEGLGRLIHLRMGGGSGDTGGGRFAEGFLTASVIFCVGPLTLLGCLQNGADAKPNLLYIKAFLDGFCSMALAASLGIGVLFSVLTVLLLQGGLAWAAYGFAERIPELSLELMNVVGGVVLLATALMILEIKKIPVANMLPAIFLPPLAVWIVERISPGTLLP